MLATRTHVGKFTRKGSLEYNKNSLFERWKLCAQENHQLSAGNSIPVAGVELS